MNSDIRIRKGDMVLVTNGKNSGKKGKVLQVLSRRGMLLIEGVNEKMRHVRPKRGDQKGQRIVVNHPVKRSNVLLVCPGCSKGTRIGSKVLESGKKVRVCKKCGRDIS